VQLGSQLRGHHPRSAAQRSHGAARKNRCLILHLRAEANARPIRRVHVPGWWYELVAPACCTGITWARAQMHPVGVVRPRRTSTEPPKTGLQYTWPWPLAQCPQAKRIVLSKQGPSVTVRDREGSGPVGLRALCSPAATERVQWGGAHGTLMLDDESSCQTGGLSGCCLRQQSGDRKRPASGRKKLGNTGMSLSGEENARALHRSKKQYRHGNFGDLNAHKKKRRMLRSQPNCGGKLVGTTCRTAERENFVLQQMNRKDLDQDRPERWNDTSRRAMSLD